MTEMVENECKKCGADIRPGTQFCYNCGESLMVSDQPELIETEEIVAKEKSDDAPELIDTQVDISANEIEDKASEKTVTLKPLDDTRNRREAAAAERKKARVRTGKTKAVKTPVWQSPSVGLDRVYLIIALLAFIVSALIVLLTVGIK